MVKMPPPPTIPKSGKTVGETVAGSADHSTLFAALKAAGLDSVLNGAGKFCLFAPNNAAFSKFSGKADADVLKMHVSTFHATQMPTRNGRSYRMLNCFPDGEEREVGVRVTVDTAENFLLAGQPDKSKVLSTIECTNGYVHICDTVLLPYPNKLPPYMEIKEPIPAGYTTPRQG